MIPSATVPQVPLLPCTPAAPCWVAGTGFRPIDDTGAACALIDTPMEGKMPPGWQMTVLPVDPWAPAPSGAGTAALASPAMPGLSALHFPTHQDRPCGCAVVPPVNPEPPAQVPLDSAGAYLGGALIAAMMMAAAWKAVPWLEAQKGASGWAADRAMEGGHA